MNHKAGTLFSHPSAGRSTVIQDSWESGFDYKLFLVVSQPLSINATLEH